jgi:hypothetical protein
MKVSNTWVQHITNPLHVYCRLIDCGFSEGVSKRLSMIYERYIYNFFFKDVAKKWTFLKRGYW